MLALILAIGTAWSEPILKGIPVGDVEGLTRPIYQTSITGWWAQIPRGTVQIYVGTNATEATKWAETMKQKMVKYRPQANDAFQAMTHASMAYGDGIGLLIVRNDNLAFMVRHDGEAQSWALTLHEATVEITDPPLAPATLVKKDNVWNVEHSEDATHLAFQGGQTSQASELTFIVPPSRLILWDKWGRAVVSDLRGTDQGSTGTPVP